MNIKKLEQYTKTKNEIKMLENRIKELQNKPDEIVSDTVRGSDSYFPYIEHTMVITGRSVVNDNRISRVRERRSKRKDRLDALLEEIEEFLDTVDDSDIRQIIQYKYIDGNSWLVTARKVFGSPCEDRARKRIERFFK